MHHIYEYVPDPQIPLMGPECAPERYRDDVALVRRADIEGTPVQLYVLTDAGWVPEVTTTGIRFCPWCGVALE